MEVLAGPTFGIDVSSSHRDGVVQAATATQETHVVAAAAAAAASLFLEDEIGGNRNGIGSGFGIGPSRKEEEDSSESSSSIGVPDDSEDDDAVSSKEVQSSFSLGLGSLEDSLPIKRGLSNHFSGKSKSFANLSEVITTKDLEKPENPFNKRRRVLVASKWSYKRSSFYSSANPKSMPLLAVLNEDEDEDERHHHEEQECPFSFSSSSSSSLENKGQEEDQVRQERIPKNLHQRRLLSFKSRSCFSLSNLQEHDEQDDDD